MCLEFIQGYSYCLLPSYRTDQGSLLRKPLYLNLFEKYEEIGQVNIHILIYQYNNPFFQYSPVLENQNPFQINFLQKSTVDQNGVDLQVDAKTGEFVERELEEIEQVSIHILM